MKHFLNKNNKVLCFLYKAVIIFIAILLILRFLYENSSFFYFKSLTLPFSLHLNENDLYMIQGEEFHLSVFGINKRISYSSTNFRVAGVNFNGRVFAYQTGKAFIIAKVNDKELKCRVHVIEISRKSINLKEEESCRLKIHGSHSFVRWKSKDKRIATVSMFGKVTAHHRGRTIITGTIKGKVLKCVVIVE